MAQTRGRAGGRILLSTELHEERDVRLFRRELRHALEGIAVLPDRLDDFVLAVNEAVANVFRHAYDNDNGTGDGDRGTCHVAVRRRPDAIVAIIEDDGDSFDPRCGYDTEPADESGRGFTIIRSLVDTFVCDVTSSGGGHIEMRLALK